MTVRWSGAFSSTTLPAGQRISGWVEGTTGAATLKNRYRDGDPAAAVLWFELYGNSNVQYATSRRTIWVDEFVPSAVDSVTPAKQNNAATWGEMQSLYSVTVPLMLEPNVRRGDLAAPRIAVKVSARRSGGGDSFVRVYAAPSLETGFVDWANYVGNAPSSQYVEWKIDNTAWEADPGWSDNGQHPTAAATEEIITAPGFSWAVYTVPDYGDVIVMETVILVAGIGDGAGNGPVVRAIQCIEEAPGA